MTFAIEIEQEKDGRWIAEIPQIPGTMVYGCTREEAVSRVEALALRVLAERIEHGEMSSKQTLTCHVARVRKGHPLLPSQSINQSPLPR